ncbi:MAG: hypothetical protein ABR600_12910 [Actinomycetota bacterium]
MMEEARSVWEGRVGDTQLVVQVQPSGRIAAQWRGKSGNERRVVVNTIDEFERSVLFQLMLTAPKDQAGLPAEIVQAVQQARVGLPDPTQAPRAPRKKRRPPRRPGPRPRRR